MAISSYFECNKHSPVHVGVLSFPEVRWCITRSINNCHDAFVALYSVHFSFRLVATCYTDKQCLASVYSVPRFSSVTEGE